MAVPSKLEKEIAELEAAEAAALEQQKKEAEAKTEPETKPGDAAQTTASEVKNTAQENKTEPPAQKQDDQKPDYFQQWSTQQGLLKEQRERIKSLEDEIKKQQESSASVLEKFTELMNKTQQPQTVQKQDELEKPKPLMTAEVLTEEEEQVLGGSETELASAIRKIAQQVVATSAAPAIEGRIASVETRLAEVEKALREDITGVKSQVASVVKTEEERKTEALSIALMKLIPNCVDIDNSADFHAWIAANSDLISGMKFKDIYVLHRNKTYDPQGLAFVMNAYLQAKGFVTPPKPETKPEVKTEQQIVSQSNVSEIPKGLEDQIGPPRSSGAGEPGGAGKVHTITYEQLIEIMNRARTNPTAGNMQAMEEAYDRYHRENSPA